MVGVGETGLLIDVGRVWSLHIGVWVVHGRTPTQPNCAPNCNIVMGILSLNGLETLSNVDYGICCR